LRFRNAATQSNCTTDDPMYSNSFEPLPGATFFWEYVDCTFNSCVVE